MSRLQRLLDRRTETDVRTAEHGALVADPGDPGQVHRRDGELYAGSACSGAVIVGQDATQRRIAVNRRRRRASPR